MPNSSSPAKATKYSPAISVRPVRCRYITIDELCRQNMSIYAMAVYQVLRFAADYSLDCDEVKMDANAIAKEAKISRRKVFEAFNELEHQHKVLKRLNLEMCRHGEKNTFMVARDYRFFAQNEDVFQQEPSSNESVQNLHTSACGALPSAPDALPSAPGALLIDHYSYQESFHNKKHIGISEETPSLSTARNLLNFPDANKTLSIDELPEKAPKVEILKSKPNSVAVCSDKATFMPSRTKSDYPKKQTFIFTDRSNLELNLSKYIQENNPFQIPWEMIEDWLTFRKRKGKSVTNTVWNRIIKELFKLKEQGGNPVDAFEEMVARGWMTVKADWIQSAVTALTPRKKGLTIDDILRA